MAPKKKKLTKKARLRKEAEEKRLQEEAARKEEEEIRHIQEEEERVRKEEKERIRVHENKIREEEHGEIEAHLKKMLAFDYQRRVEAWENKRWNDYLFKTKEIDPLDLRQVNTFITQWNEDTDYKAETILKKCHICIQIIDEIFCAIYTYPYEDQKTRSLWQEGIDNLKHAIAEKLDYATFTLLKDADQYVDDKSFNMEFGVRDRHITMLLWVNLYMAVQREGMNPKFGFEFQLPPGLVTERCAVRVMQMASEHVNIKLRNMDPINETDKKNTKETKNMKIDLQTQVSTEKLNEPASTFTEPEQHENLVDKNGEKNDIKEIPETQELFSPNDLKEDIFNEEKPQVLDHTVVDNDVSKTEKLSNQTANKTMNQEVELKLDEQNNEVENKENNLGNQIQYPEKDKSKIEDVEIEKVKSDLSFKSHSNIYNETKNRTAKVDPPKKPECKPIDMNEYFLVGGVTHFDYLEVPKLTVRHGGITYIHREKVELKQMEYRQLLKNVNNVSDGSSANTENNAANKKKDNLPNLNKRMLLKIRLPENVAWHETTKLARFSPKRNAFSADGIFQDKYDIDSNQMSFLTEYFGIYGVLQNKYINFPYKGWQLRSGKLVQLILDGQFLSLTLEVSEHGCRVRDLKPALKSIQEELGSTWRTTEQLIQKLQSMDINIAAEENYRSYIKLPVKNETLENSVYDSISLQSKNVDFSCSKWNQRAERDEIVLQFKSSSQPKEVGYHLVLITPSRTVELKAGEENFSKEVMESREFSSTLFHLISKNFPDYNKPETNLEDACCLWNVRSLLRCCRILSCS